MERRIYRPNPAPSRRMEWVSLPSGDLCVWELTIAEMAQITDRAARPAVDPRGGQDRTALILYQLIYACHQGEAPDAARIWGDADLAVVGALSLEEFNQIYAALQRVCGTGATEEEILRDFTPATGAPSSSELASSALKSSAASRKSLTCP